MTVTSDAMFGGDRGFALLIVAIALAALSLIFAAAISTTHQHLVATTAHLARVRLAAAVEGAVTTAAYDLSTAREVEPAILNAPQELNIGGIAVTARARPEAAKLDLNAVSPELLYRYFLVSGLDKELAQQLIEAIRARRKDADPAYAKAHDKERAPPFEAVSELFALKGVTDDVTQCVEPDLTVFTGLVSVDTDDASDRVREAAGLEAKSPTAPRAASAATAGRAVAAGEIFEVTARAHDDETGQTQSRQVVLRVTGNSRSPIWTLAVHSPAPDAEKAQAACDRLKPPQRTADARDARQ
jgi:type II secretory pathway component PulK